MVNSADITNRALVEIGGQATVSGTVPNLTGGGGASGYANTVYESLVLMILRDQDFEFARRTAVLAVSGNVPAAPWQFEYVYPDDCVKIRQVVPATQSEFDPQPVQWSVYESIGTSNPGKVIGTNELNAQIVYTTSDVTEDQWDSMFAESMVRMLASSLAMGNAGRPDVAREKLQEAGGIMQAGEGRDS